MNMMNHLVKWEFGILKCLWALVHLICGPNLSNPFEKSCVAKILCVDEPAPPKETLE